MSSSLCAAIAAVISSLISEQKTRSSLLVNHLPISRHTSGSVFRGKKLKRNLLEVMPSFHKLVQFPMPLPLRPGGLLGFNIMFHR